MVLPTVCHVRRTSSATLPMSDTDTFGNSDLHQRIGRFGAWRATGQRGLPGPDWLGRTWLLDCLAFRAAVAPPAIAAIAAMPPTRSRAAVFPLLVLPAAPSASLCDGVDDEVGGGKKPCPAEVVGVGVGVVNAAVGVGVGVGVGMGIGVGVGFGAGVAAGANAVAEALNEAMVAAPPGGTHLVLADTPKTLCQWTIWVSTMVLVPLFAMKLTFAGGSAYGCSVGFPCVTWVIFIFVVETLIFKVDSAYRLPAGNATGPFLNPLVYVIVAVTGLFGFGAVGDRVTVTGSENWNAVVPPAKRQVTVIGVVAAWAPGAHSTTAPLMVAASDAVRARRERARMKPPPGESHRDGPRVGARGVHLMTLVRTGQVKQDYPRSARRNSGPPSAIGGVVRRECEVRSVGPYRCHIHAEVGGGPGRGGVGDDEEPGFRAGYPLGNRALQS